MENILPKLKFKGSWRIYQERVLVELRHHFADKKLHIVAAPGAGKTTLGIEVIRQLGHSTLILSPTIVIKNQWKYRILEDFCNNDVTPDEISAKLEEVKDITTGTYQRLQAIYKKGLQEEFIKQLKEREVKTIVFDEAHHLRTEWYKTLKHLITELSNDEPDFKIISLTATPPYDVEEKEWNNYYELCGPIDAEISVPELVKYKNLCPHQDLIYLSDLNKEEKKIVFNFKENREKFFKYIERNSDLLYSIETSDFITNFADNSELIYTNTDFTIALLSYLFSIDSTHIKATYLLNFLELKREQIPVFSYDIAEDLFNGILGKFKKHFKNIPTLKSKIKEYGLLKNASKVDFQGRTNFRKLYARSQNKLNSLVEITKAEYATLQENLREVILLDYIGTDSGGYGLNITSAFKLLNTEKPEGLKIAVLTGSLILIPKRAKPLLDEIIVEYNYSGKVLTSEYDENYLRVESYGDIDVVKIISELFAQGGSNVLIGTHALLGEGWDSPCINTLIIGSVVSSFMLSNQMRGRALRVDPDTPQKTANIWHLVAMESKFDKGFDFNAISKRFDTFDGICYDKKQIDCGINRLNIDYQNYTPERISELNGISLTRATDRKLLTVRWKKCLGNTKPKDKVFDGLSIDAIQLEFIKFKKASPLTNIAMLWNRVISFIISPSTIGYLYCIFLGWLTTVFINIHQDSFSIFITIILSIIYFVVFVLLHHESQIDISKYTFSQRVKYYATYSPKCYHSVLFFIEAFVFLFTGVFSFFVSGPTMFKIYTILTFYSLARTTDKKNLTNIFYFICYLVIATYGSILEMSYNFFYLWLLRISFCGFFIVLITPKLFMLIKAYFMTPLHYFLKFISNELKLIFCCCPTYIVIANNLLKTLCHFKKISCAYWEVELKEKKNEYLVLTNCSAKDSAIFRATFLEMLERKKINPEYIFKLKEQKEKTIVPPSKFNLEEVTFFAKKLEKDFGEIAIIETKNLAGKRELLKAKYNDFLVAKASNKRFWGTGK